MFYALKVLMNENGQHIDFLLAVARELGRSLLISHYCVIFSNCMPFIQELPEPQRYQLFLDLKGANKSIEANPYLAVIMGLLIGIVESRKFEKKLLSYIMKIVHRLHSKFQRIILVRFISRRC